MGDTGEGAKLTGGAVPGLYAVTRGGAHDVTSSSGETRAGANSVLSHIILCTDIAFCTNATIYNCSLVTMNERKSMMTDEVEFTAKSKLFEGRKRLSAWVSVELWEGIKFQAIKERTTVEVLVGEACEKLLAERNK